VKSISVISMMEIQYSKQARKYLVKMQAKKAIKIVETIEKIAEGKVEGLNITTLGTVNTYLVRVGDYRAIYEIKNAELILVVIRVGSRGDVTK
jgi:mRNA interferase RelE/StbE